MQACTCECVFENSPGCSPESRDLSGLKVIPMSQNSELDTGTRKQRNADVFWTIQASFVFESVECLNSLVLCLEGCFLVIHYVSFALLA